MAFRRRGSNAGWVSDVVICKSSLSWLALLIPFNWGAKNNVLMALMMNNDNMSVQEKQKFYFLWNKIERVLMIILNTEKKKENGS